MSTDLAIITVTRALSTILRLNIPASMGIGGVDATQGVDVTNFPPHKVRDLDKTKNIVNLFLYRTEINAAWRNMPIPSQAKPGENAPPPLALNLEYLVTAYGEGEKEDLAHFFLGTAMRVLHDCTIVPRHALEVEVDGKGEVHRQLENIRVTPRPFSLEEMSKLWSTFQTPYRISAAYTVTVLLIESRIPIKSGPPVLKRGPEDRGVTTVTTPPPTLALARADSGFASARLNETVTLLGENLDNATVDAMLSHPSLEKPIKLPVTIVDEKTVTLALPDPGAVAGTAAAWPAGIYSVSLVVTRPNQPVWTTNEVPLSLAPTVTVTPNTFSPPDTDFNLTIDAIPQVHDGQSVFVLWGNEQVNPTSVTTPGNPDAATTIVAKVQAPEGIYRVRLRVDGVDSIPIKITNGLFEFDDNQSVKVQP